MGVYFNTRFEGSTRHVSLNKNIIYSTYPITKSIIAYDSNFTVNFSINVVAGQSTQIITPNVGRGDGITIIYVEYIISICGIMFTTQVIHTIYTYLPTHYGNHTTLPKSINQNL